MRIGFNRITEKSLDIRHFSGESSMVSSVEKIFMALRQLFRERIKQRRWSAQMQGAAMRVHSELR